MANSPFLSYILQGISQFIHVRIPSYDGRHPSRVDNLLAGIQGFSRTFQLHLAAHLHFPARRRAPSPRAALRSEALALSFPCYSGPRSFFLRTYMCIDTLGLRVMSC